MTGPSFIIVRVGWILSDAGNAKRLRKKGLLALGCLPPSIPSDAPVLLKFRDDAGQLVIDNAATFLQLHDEPFLKSQVFAEYVLSSSNPKEYFALFLEGSPSLARCVVTTWSSDRFADLERSDPTLRLQAFDVPPQTSTCVTNLAAVNALHGEVASLDPDLFALYTSSYLASQHLVTPLFAHVMSLRSEDNLNFLLQLKTIAEQLRAIMDQSSPTAKIHKIERSHLDLWSAVQNEYIAFLDGGVARIPGIANIEPLAMRVGVYGVRPGEHDLSVRETWTMAPFILSDILDPDRGIVEHTDRKRLLEASRYTLEPLTALAHLREHPSTYAMFLHGPLITAFLMYDEAEPNFIPSLAHGFLEEHGITKDTVLSEITDVPRDPSNVPLWNQFMAIYCIVLKRLMSHPSPVLGVVERSTGRHLCLALLNQLVADKVVTRTYVNRLLQILIRYDINDDFLFGCMLRDGEYISPLPIKKNPVRRARPRWQPVVAQYPTPHATLLKVSDASFPIRIEMNEATCSTGHADYIRLLYHTARLLPRYAFPVGLDIADKYAKVPDWIARGVSAELSASVLRRAIQTGDSHLVSQIRNLLARNPRDFFYRPGARL